MAVRYFLLLDERKEASSRFDISLRKKVIGKFLEKGDSSKIIAQILQEIIFKTSDIFYKKMIKSK